MIYAVNKRTKKHRIHTPGYPSSLDEEFVETTTDGWIPWRSDEYWSPMPGGSRCEIRLSSGDGFIISDPEDWDWSEGGDQWIVAYRPILDDASPDIDVTRLVSERQSPEWDGEGLPPVGCDVGHPTGRGTVMLPPDVNGVTIIQSTESGSDGEYKRVAASACRPIRREEDEAVGDMLDCMPFDCSDTDSRAMAEFARALYRAGYRKNDD